MAKPKKLGRPTTYEPEYCERLEEHMGQGYSFESFGGISKVCKDTLFEWAKVHSEFREAKARGLEAGRLFWEKQGIEGLYTITEYDEKGKVTSSKSINQTIWSINMKNRFGWREKQPGEEANVNINNNNFVHKTTDELEARFEEIVRDYKKEQE